MRVLIAWGSKRGGTEGIGRTVTEALREAGHDAIGLPAAEVRRLDGFDAVIVGGALYANRWAPAARRFVRRHVPELRRVPTWFFSSGPLDDSAGRAAIPPTEQVASFMERVGALGHVTFGGRLAADAKGFPASAMAKTRAGDWRDPVQIRAWATAVSQAIPLAKPGTPIAQPGRSLFRLARHGLLGWALCALVMAGLLRATSLTTALVLHGLLAPAIFAVIARHYFAARGAREPLATAFGFVGIVAILDLVIVAGLAHQGLAIFGSILGFWLPLALIFGVTSAVGTISGMAPARTRVSRA
jgi:menaquinone-dependent protoporphyrinogen oxidase